MTSPIKSALSILILAFTLFILPSVFAQETVSVTASQAVNIRTGPGLNHAVRGVLHQSLSATGRNDFDTSRSCLGDNTDLDMWIRVDHNGIEGWVARCAVLVEGDLDQLSIVVADSPLLVDDLRPMTENVLRSDYNEPKPDGDYVVGFTRARVNVRDEPSLQGNIIAITAPIEDFFVTGRTENSSWLQITWDGDQTGWVAGYLMLIPYEWTKTVPVK